MSRKSINSVIPALVMIVTLCGITAVAQNSGNNNKSGNGQVNTNTKMTYHGGQLMLGSQNIYLTWYGCWDDSCGNFGNTTTQTIMTDLVSSLGGSPYFQINAMYPDEFGRRPTGAIFYAGTVFDRYSHGNELTRQQIVGILRDQIEDLELPLDPAGIYVVIASADVSSAETGFCAPGALAHHGLGQAFGTEFKYVFLGNPKRCPTIAAPQFMSGDVQLPTPNGDLAADAMASTLAQVLSRTITNPRGDGWFDRYGLETAAKCVGQFGTTYLTANGARANLKLGYRDYLIQENWVNDRKGHCAMNSSL